MRYLILMIAFPILALAQTEELDCKRLKTIASGLEKQIQTKFVKTDCNKQPESGIAGYDYRCKDLSAVEAQLRSVENEIALFKGVESLRSETMSAKDALDAYNKNGAITYKQSPVDASHNLYKHLQIASAVEEILNTKGIKENLITELAKATDADMSDVVKFNEFVKSTCVKIGVHLDRSPICKDPKNLTEDVMNEVNGLLLVGKRTERKFNDKQVKELKKAMSIKDGDDSYSFSKMMAEVKAPAEGAAFTAKEMAALATITIKPESEEKYDFMKNVRVASKSLVDSKPISTAQALPERFSQLFTSLRQREEWELKAKLSAVLNELGSTIPEDVKAACSPIRTLSGNVEACINAFSKNDKVSQAQKNTAGNILLELKHGQNYLAKIDQVMKDCAPDNEAVMPATCDQYINTRTEELNKKATHLMTIRDNILKDSADLMIARDLAVETIVNQKSCMTRTDTSIECDEALGTISTSAIALSDASNEIILMYTKPIPKTDIDAHCKDTSKGHPHLVDICKIAQAKASQDKPVKKLNPDSWESPTSAPGARSAGQGWADLLGSFASAASTLFTPSQQTINPYMGMYPMAAPMGGARDIKNQIMDPYMVSGFGSYGTTPGLRPYSSINSNVGTASAYSFGSSTFFNSPVGW